MKKVMLFWTLALLAVLVVPVYAEVQNVKVSGDIRTYGAYRNDFDLREETGTGTTSFDDDRDWINTATRVRVDADLTDNVSTTVRVLNERDWGLEEDTRTESGDSSIVIDLANVTLKEFLYSPLTTTIGRQELRYGNALVVGDVDGNASSRETGLVAQEFSRRKAFDAVRAVLDFDPIVVDSFHAIIDETGNGTGGANGSQDWTLTGVDVAYAVGDYNANIAGYWVWNHNVADATPTPPQLGGAWTTSTTHGRSVHTLGLRGNMEPVAGLDLGAEVALQSGEYSGVRDQSASAVQVDGAYTFDAKMKPVLKLAYAFFSGEEAGNTGDQESWLATFEDQTFGIIADRMQLTTVSGGTPHGASTNMHIFNVGGSIQPLDDVTLTLDWYNFTLAEENETSASSSDVYTTNDEYGDEVDVTVRYDYTEDVAFDGTFAVFSPGNAWETDAQDNAVQATGGVTVAF